MAELRVAPAVRPPRVRLRVPSDKSISHRAAILGALADGDTLIRDYLQSETTLATLDCLRQLGVAIEPHGGGDILVRGAGLRGLREPDGPLFCKGSGTTLRLLAGVCAGQDFLTILDATLALRRRPMARVVEPLRALGATVLGRDGGRLAPLAIRGRALRGIDWTTPVASAQVKSAILLAGLFAEGETTVREPGPSRDHTERMLRGFGVRVTDLTPPTPLPHGGRGEIAGAIPPPPAGEGAGERGPSPRERGETAGCALRPSRLVSPGEVAVPGDISSAAFLLVAGLLIPGAEVAVESVGVNPTRTGLLDALSLLGAAVDVESQRESSGEPIADLVARGDRALRGAAIGGDLVPRAIDEFPILAVAATQAAGETVVRDAAELRAKESDRIATLAAELRRLGAEVEERPDGFAILGPTRLRGARVSAHGDHRLAMSLAVAGLIAEGETRIAGWECVADSYPGFAEALAALAGPDRVEVIG